MLIRPSPHALLLLLLALLTCGRLGAADRLSLDGDGWTIAPQAAIAATGEDLSAHDAAPAGTWVKASVPGTVFASYVADGLEPEPTYGDAIAHVHRELYDRNFWYRTVFTAPALTPGSHAWLILDGVNRDGDVFLDGHALGSLHGFLQRGAFDVTALIRPGAANVLAVLVHVPVVAGNTAHTHNAPSPCYVCSVGWDWMPRVPGLEMGIHRSVALLVTGAVRLIDPWVRTPVATPQTGEVVMQTEIENAADAPVRGRLQAAIGPGGPVVELPLALAAHERRTVRLDPQTFPTLRLAGPRLWWPNGYGDPDLYRCRLSFLIGDATSDARDITFGIRRYTYSTERGVLRLAVNGVPLFLKGGSWGMAEFMLRCRGAAYDTRLRLQRAMHFNMIRNWMGMTTDDAFYDACDRAGMMVWDEFWLNSSGGMPADPGVFRANTIEKIKEVRNHACVALWCGENEAAPPAPLDDWLRQDIATYDAGDRYYQPNSHSENLSGSGPWHNLDIPAYFRGVPPAWGGNRGPDYGLRSEIGLATACTVDSFARFMPTSQAWPINGLWNLHFLGSSAANAGPHEYLAAISRSYGTPADALDFCRKAQLLNQETMKALFEGWLDHSDSGASGVLIWMSQSAFPSFVWQTYDYYLDPTGAYWGARSACEPLHIYWNAADNRVRVVDTSGRDAPHCTARIRICDLRGHVSFERVIPVDATCRRVADCCILDFPRGGPPVQLAILQLTDATGTLVSDNRYWRAADGIDDRALNGLPPVALEVSATTTHQAGTVRVAATITVPPQAPAVAFAIHPCIRRAGDGRPVLPCYSDAGDFILLPGEGRQVSLEYSLADAGGRDGTLVVDAWNTAPHPLAPYDHADLAYHCPATASSSADADDAPQYAVDDDGATQWTSGYPLAPGGEWLRIDLGSQRTIGSIAISWALGRGSAIRGFEVQTSDDDRTWATIGRATGPVRGWTSTLTGLHVQGRFLRVLITAAVSRSGVGIASCVVHAP